MFNIVMIIPTGIGCEIGGHAGDANPIARLLGSVCDNLILHPNVVNASDINEMPDNSWYVEGSMLDRFLGGEINLKKPFSNRILVAVNPPIKNETINAVSAARVTLGVDVSILVLDAPLRMKATMLDGCASGIVYEWQGLVKQVRKYDFDALAITSQIEVDKDVALNYLQNGGINPWGGVEALASTLIAGAIDKPVAHAPMGDILEDFNEVVDPRIAPEVISVCYLQCVLKGLHKAPRISNKGLTNKDIDFLISPYGCYGRPHIACEKNDIPIVLVKENSTCLNIYPKKYILLDNYLEVAGFLTAQKLGISPSVIRRPVEKTTILGDKLEAV